MGGAHAETPTHELHLSLFVSGLSGSTEEFAEFLPVLVFFKRLLLRPLKLYVPKALTLL